MSEPNLYELMHNAIQKRADEVAERLKDVAPYNMDKAEEDILSIGRKIIESTPDIPGHKTLILGWDDIISNPQNRKMLIMYVTNMYPF